MDVKKGVVVFVFVVGVLFSFTGSALAVIDWRPIFENDCSDESILKIWDEVFEESSDGVEIVTNYEYSYKTSSRFCSNIIARKNDGVSKVWVMSTNSEVSPGSFLAFYTDAGNKFYYNDVMSKEGFISDYKDNTWFPRHNKATKDYAIGDGGDAVEFYNSIIKPDIISLEKDSKDIEFEVFYYRSIENGAAGDLDYSNEYTVFDDKAFVSLFISFEELDVPVVDNSDTNPDVNSNSGSSGAVNDDESGSGWIVWVGILFGILFVVLLAFNLWFFLLRKK